jgi:hypothetical protein
VELIRYIDYKASEISSLFADQEKITKAPLMGAIICEAYGKYREAARFYLVMKNYTEITRCAQLHVDNNPSLKSTDSLCVFQASADPFYRAVRKCLVDRELEEINARIVSRLK